MERDRRIINHPVLGEYEQIVFDSTEEAGHVALASEGKYGWEMPSDPVIERLTGETIDKTVLEIGPGKGNVFAIPSLASGAKELYALDITAQDISDLVSKARELGLSEKLHTQLIPEQWWFASLLSSPTVRQLLLLEDESTPQVPPDGSVDVMIARHVIQFGTHESALRVLDLASVALKQGGKFIAINFTPFTGYLYRRDNGETIQTIERLNREFTKRTTDRPGGYLNRNDGILKVNLADVTGRKELDKGEDQKFTYFDTATLYGILLRWVQSRKERGLLVDLVLSAEFYFSPSRIAQFNKLSEDPDLALKENHCFTLVKM